MTPENMTLNVVHINSDDRDRIVQGRLLTVEFMLMIASVYTCHDYPVHACT